MDPKSARPATMEIGYHSEQPDGHRYFGDRPDSEVWKMFKAGHEGAFKFIYDTYFSILFKYGTHFTKDRGLIMDAIHDLFLELHQSKNLANTDNIRFYLLKAFRWKILRLMNKRKVLTNFPGENKVFQTAMEISHEAKLINIQVGETQLNRLRKAMDGLTGRQREALYYFYDQGLGYKEVAEMMGLSTTKSARNIIYKAVDILRAYFRSASK